MLAFCSSYVGRLLQVLLNKIMSQF